MNRSLLPPGQVGFVEADSCLVLAPHYDDETLGCGGLIHQLAESGTKVAVLFLSDGSGGVEEIEDRQTYSGQRRLEGEAAVEVLGVAETHHLGLPDGDLEHHRVAIREAISQRLTEQTPDLLLCPGPLEITRDHQATFGALFDLLHSLRQGDSLWDVAMSLRVLLYEINHPAYPNLLIDVGGQLGVIERAMVEYPSQQERHDYLAAGVGLRRYRTHSLGLETEAAEGYYQLRVEDFTHHDYASLVQSLGGSPSVVEVHEGPTLSVIVRTCNRPELVVEALNSIAASSYRRIEVVLVVDGGGEAPVPEGFPFPLQRVDLVPNLGRAGAANAGVQAATGDFVAFLDDDDLVGWDHYSLLAGMVVAAEVSVVYSDAAVVSYGLGGGSGWQEVERRLPYSRDFDPDLLLVDNYIPLNTLLIKRRLFEEAGTFDTDLPFFEDWDFLIRLARCVPFRHLPQVTCEYRHFQGGGHILGERPRDHPEFLELKRQVIDRYRDSLTSARLARLVDTLRRESVDGNEAARAMGRDRDAARQELTELSQTYHRVHGEVVGMREELPPLREKVAEQEEHLARLYAEIERLGRVIEAMEGTRAWHVHQWLQRRRS